MTFGKESVKELLTKSVERKVSDAITGPILQAYSKGGFGLAFLVLGALLLFTAGFVSSTRVFWLFASAGLLLILVVVVLFYYKSIRPLRQVAAEIEKHAEMIDSIQLAAVQMTDIVALLQSAAFKYSDELQQVLQQTATLAAPLPVIGPKVSALVTQTLGNYAPRIVRASDDIRTVIDGTRSALVTADAAKLAEYARNLAELKATLSAAVSAPSA